MSRMQFEDLPSKETPINAENLNKLNNVVISPTEPTTGEEVWIKSGGKNFFNKNKATLRYLALKDSGTLTYAHKMAVSDYIIVEKLESIILSGMTNELTNGGAFYDSSKTYISGFTLNEILSGVSVPSNAKYVRVNTSIVELDVTQLEEGLVATEYEPYVDKEIYVKNDNGVYELFDKVERTSIITGGLTPTNEYIDGKRVYVKRVDFGALPNASTKTLSTGISKSLYNFEYFRGKAISGTYTISLPNISLHGLNYCTTCGIDGSATTYQVEITTGTDRSAWTGIIDIYVTKK